MFVSSFSLKIFQNSVRYYKPLSMSLRKILGFHFSIQNWIGSHMSVKIRNIRAKFHENLVALRRDKETGKHGEVISPFYQLFIEHVCK